MSGTINKVFKNLSKMFKNSKEANIVNRLDELCHEDSRDLLIPSIWSDAKACKLILSAIKSQTVEDPLLIIHWNENAFNPVNGSRDNDPTHNLQSLFNSIKNSGGEDVENKHIAFVFDTGPELARCLIQLPAWSRKRANMPDVAYSVIRLNKLNSTGEYEVEPCEHAFSPV